MVPALSDWLPPLSRPVREESDKPPCCEAELFWLSWPAALESVSCRGRRMGKTGKQGAADNSGAKQAFGEFHVVADPDV